MKLGDDALVAVNLINKKIRINNRSMKIMNKEQLLKNPSNNKPHVVLLGAGASRAGFPNGDAAGKQLPLMNDLVDVVRLKSLLKRHKINSSGNFENIYANIKDINLREKIEEKINDYFCGLSLPSTATHYDRLLLALREKDAVFTFNWDPFLFDAFKRNQHVVSLPPIFFLHGNVRIGSCEEHDEWGNRDALCKECNKKFINVPLLYPLEQKNYSESNKYTAERWSCAEAFFANAFTLTIFGYSAPASDIKAVDLLNTAWLRESNREFEHVEVIDILTARTLSERWKGFTPTGHFKPESSFEKSRLWRWPRRSCEALFYPMNQGIPCEDFPLPKTDNLNELQDAIKEIAKYEKQQ